MVIISDQFLPKLMIIALSSIPFASCFLSRHIITSNPTFSTITTHPHHQKLFFNNPLNSLNEHPQKKTPPDDDGYPVAISYQNRTTSITVKPTESILSALERNAIVRNQLCLSSIPSDCRRGCCLTCAARHVEGSVREHLRRGEDVGLVEGISDNILGAESGFVLACSSFVEGDGVRLRIMENDEVWEIMHDDATSDLALDMKILATTKRLAAELDVPTWKRETEDVLKRDIEYE